MQRNIKVVLGFVPYSSAFLLAKRASSVLVNFSHKRAATLLLSVCLGLSFALPVTKPVFSQSVPYQIAPNPSSLSDEPARWTQEDMTIEQQYATARKELAAAYQIALTECNAFTGQVRLECIAQAKSDFERELSLLGFRLGPSR